MKKIIRLTERDLTRIVKRVMLEQPKTLPSVNLVVQELKVKNPSTTNLDNNITVKTNTNTVMYGKCKTRSNPNNCFISNTSTLENGTYPPLSFDGEIILYHNSVKYRCKINKPCMPI